MGFLDWLQGSAFANWVLTTYWVYPWVISLHSIGMGFLVGIVFVLSLRVLGVGSFAIAPMQRFLLVAHIAFIVNLLSGFTLFSIDARSFFMSPTFRIKMLCIVLGITVSLALTRMLFGESARAHPAVTPPPAAKLLAVFAILFWSGAILAGRLTAYLP